MATLTTGKTVEAFPISDRSEMAKQLVALGVPGHICQALATEVERYADAARYGYVMPPTMAAGRVLDKAYGLSIAGTTTGQRITNVVVEAMAKVGV